MKYKKYDILKQLTERKLAGIDWKDKIYLYLPRPKLGIVFIKLLFCGTVGCNNWEIAAVVDVAVGDGFIMIKSC